MVRQSQTPAMTAGDLIERISAPSGKDFLKYLAELCWNGRDAGARRILIEFLTVDGKKMSVRVIDDGIGMNEKRRSAFVSLGLSNWDVKGREIRGKNGTGRLGCFHHGTRMSAETKSANEDVHAISFDRAELAAILEKRAAWWTVRPLTPTDAIKTTGTVITIHDVDRKASKEPQAVIEGLAAYLGIDMWDTVYVRGFDGQTKPVAPRELRGDLVRGQTDIPEAGLISWHIGVAQQTPRTIEYVEMFAMSRVCTLADFFKRAAKIQEATPFLLACRPVLEHRSVSGIVNVPILNAFVGDGRNEFGEELFERIDLVLAVLRAMREKIVPEVEKAIGLTSDQISTPDDAAVIRSVLERIGGTAARQLGGGTGTGTTRAGLSVSPISFYLLTGGTQEIAVKNPRPGATVRWEAKRGGTVSSLTGTKTVFIAGSAPAAGEIVVTESIAGEASRSATVTPTVVREFPFQFEPASRQARPNEPITLSLRYPSKWKGRITWKALDDGVTLERKGDSNGIGVETAICTAGDTGIVTVEARAGDETASCVIRVQHDVEARAVGNQACGIEFEGHFYQLGVSNFPAGTEGDRHMIFSEPGEPGVTIVMINMRAGMFAGLNAGERIQTIVQLLAGVIAETELVRQTIGAVDPRDFAKHLRLKTNTVTNHLFARFAKKP